MVPFKLYGRARREQTADDDTWSEPVIFITHYERHANECSHPIVFHGNLSESLRRMRGAWAVCARFDRCDQGLPGHNG